MILFIFVFSNSFFSGCIENNQNDVLNDNLEINIGMSQDISGFYPWIIRDIISISVNQNFFNPLVEIDNETRGIIPALAESWNNPDNLTWRFFLRDGVKFHNGDDFTSEDVKFTIEYLKNFSFYYDRLSSIVNITILDDFTVDLKTSNIDSLLLYDLLLVNILSKDYMLSIMDTNESWPIGTGPYKLKEYIPNDYVSLERFDEYWKGAPQIKLVNFIVMNGSEELLNGVIDGDLDIAPMSFDYIEDIINDDDLKLLSVETPGVVYLGFDFRENDSFGFFGEKNPVSDLRVRKAMYHAINIEDFIDEKINVSSRAPISQFITFNTFGYNPKIKRLEYDIEKASDLMNDAGYNDGFTIVIDCPDSPGAISLCNMISDHLSLINISVIINALPFNEHLAELYYKNTSFYITGFSPLTAEGSINLLLLTSDMDEGLGIWNYGNYSNKDVDDLYEKLCNNTEPSIRKKLIQDIFMIAMDDVAWIPLYSSRAFYGVSQNISWNPRPSLYIILEEIHIH